MRKYPTYYRDQVRGDCLRKHFRKVFTLAPTSSGDKQRWDVNHDFHIDAYANRRGVQKTVQKINPTESGHIDYVLIDYMRMTPSYYADKILIGTTATKHNCGRDLIE